MDFKLTEEQELIRQNMREFAETYVDPIAAEIDENSRHPAELFKKLAEGDWMGIPIPVEYGGAGADYLTHALVVEELSRSCSSTGFTVSIHVGIACMLTLLFGTEEQKQKFLTPMAKGEKLGAFVLTEPGAGTDVMGAMSSQFLATHSCTFRIARETAVQVANSTSGRFSGHKNWPTAANSRAADSSAA